jgi:hypothetical protein
VLEQKQLNSFTQANSQQRYPPVFEQELFVVVEMIKKTGGKGGASLMNWCVFFVHVN